MKERFEGEQNRPQLVASLRRQEFAGGKLEIATALADAGELVEFRPGENIIVQHAADNDIYLLVTGVVAVIVNGAQVATRAAGQHVGEMAAIEPSLPRSATVTVLENAVVLKLSSAAFLSVGHSFPELWLPIAQELSKRLHQRNKTIYPPNKAPKLFIMSSSEALKIAHALRSGLEKDVFSTVWDDGVFFAGGYPLEALEKQVGESDFAVAIAEPDDISESRGQRAPTVRDNVLFELGLFMGKLSRYRTILVHPKVKDLKLPSDLQGLTLVPYQAGDDATIAERIAPVCDTIRDLVLRLGVRTFSIEKDR
ncbi:MULTISPECIES: TIR domain-containing protein [unclassified Bradyrhizobium]|uniref:TIR domain-containing protein n=1 Tax=unclassified Bradyrhizobium TaxID=2631580 RepID=UPI00211F1BD6|nr:MULTISPECIES: TIR domain-containing protein [unclassified Bradyrhizobium]MDD1532688.1 cyclic nucleotide-binding protein [Bradyrhizobium sp. WBOS8]MDD1581600.1 cyclic nucleotide-binding protein [Bradyrhizobium sp. WBOS4]UUO49872.1 cyclic nucleotide-binding protein [Bradyrhizobium sp. WBOS04]UUO58639.1 cyclic nucleotide-binding protein [Bradyrhizobium sp. WBOS08]